MMSNPNAGTPGANNPGIEGEDKVATKRRPGRPPNPETLARREAEAQAAERAAERVVVKVLCNTMDPDADHNAPKDRIRDLSARKLWAGDKNHPRYADVPRQWAQALMESDSVRQASDSETQAYYAGELLTARGEPNRATRYVAP